MYFVFFFFKQKTAYEMRISDWSSDVCSSDLKRPGKIRFQYQKGVPLLIVGDGSRLTMIDYEVNQVQSWPVKNSPLGALLDPDRDISRYAKLIPTDSRDVLSEIGRASCRERVCQYV